MPHAGVCSPCCGSPRFGLYRIVAASTYRNCVALRTLQIPHQCWVRVWWGCGLFRRLCRRSRVGSLPQSVCNLPCSPHLEPGWDLAVSVHSSCVACGIPQGVCTISRARLSMGADHHCGRVGLITSACAAVYWLEVWPYPCGPAGVARRLQDRGTPLGCRVAALLFQGVFRRGRCEVASQRRPGLFNFSVPLHVFPSALRQNDCLLPLDEGKEGPHNCRRCVCSSD